MPGLKRLVKNLDTEGGKLLMYVQYGTSTVPVPVGTRTCWYRTQALSFTGTGTNTFSKNCSLSGLPPPHPEAPQG
jgi:hypothetical protein